MRRMFDRCSGVLMGCRCSPPMLPAMYSVAFSSDGFRLLTGGGSGRANVWDLAAAPSAVPVSLETWQRRIRAVRLSRPKAYPPELVQSVRAQLLALDEQRLLSW